MSSPLPATGTASTPQRTSPWPSGEVGELVAELQWQDSAAELDEDLRHRLGAEAADVLICLVRLADIAGLDLIAEATSKIALNQQRYPVEQAYGNSAKYSHYPSQT